MMNGVRQKSDTDLVGEIRSGDPDRRNAAFRSLYLSPKVNGKIAIWAKKSGLRDMQPEDVLQEALVALDEAVCSGRFEGKSAIETYLLSICKNMIRDSVKKVRHVLIRADLPDELNEENVEALIEVVEADQQERLRDQLLSGALSQLSDKCREAIALFYFQEKNMEQVALERGLANAEQAKKAVHRCRQQLRDRLKAIPGFEQLLLMIKQ